MDLKKESNEYGADKSSAADFHKTSKDWYPEAVMHFNPDEVVDGELLYPSQPGQSAPNPHLRRFVKKGWKDVWAGVLFLVISFVTIFWGLNNMLTYERSTSNDSAKDEDFVLNWLVFAVPLVAVILSVTTSLVSLMLFTTIPEKMVWLGNIFSVCITLGLGMLMLLSGSIFVAILFMFVGAMQGLWVYYVRTRIPFTALLLRTAVKVTSNYKSIYGLNFILVPVASIYFIFWSFAIAPSAERAQTDNFAAADSVFVCFLVFSFFWVMQVLPNVLTVTTAGLTATWYFVGMNNMPENPTLMSFKRAVTTSFGSICFGSLIVAVIQFLRWLAESSRRNENLNLLTCVADCILACLQGIAEYINRYAYIHIAMYGYDYITAAKHTFELMQQSLLQALINDCLLDGTLSMLTLSLSILNAVVVGAIFWSAMAGFAAFVFAFLIHSIFFNVVSTAVATIFVCFAEVPDALSATDNELYVTFQGATQV